MEKQKLDFEATIKALKAGIIKVTLLADNNQDLSSTAKATAFCRTLKQNEEILAVLSNTQENWKGNIRTCF